MLTLDRGVLALAGASIVFLIFYGIRHRIREEDSLFKTREADRIREADRACEKKPMEPFQLTGFVHDRSDHEVLEVPLNATQDEIQKAYKRMMMRYHPDRVGRPGSREWQDAQKIAERINLAKSRLIKK